MGFKVFFDANVVIPINLCNLLLNLADEKDRHVLAAAIRREAAVLVTANLQDFPSSSTSQYELEVVHPDHFLQDQLDLYPLETLEVLRAIPQRNKRPPTTLLELLVALRKLVSDFTQLASYAVETPEAVGQSALFHIPKVRPSEQDIFFPNGPNDFTHPKTVAYRWFNAVFGDEPHQVFETLCFRATDFPSREEVASLIDGHGLTEGVDYAIEDERVAYMKLIQTDNESLQAFRTGSYQGLALTLVQLDNQE